MSERRISDLIPERVAFTQLAEECVELAHASLKMGRFADPEQCEAVGFAQEDAVCMNFYEEIADVLCCLEVAMACKRLENVVLSEDIIMEMKEAKYRRWLDRLTAKGA